MSVRQVNRRDPKTGAVRKFWMIDVDYQYPDGRRERIRKVSPVQTKRGAEQYERELRQSMGDGTFGKETEPAPLFGAFAEEFMSTYAETNNKPSEVQSKRSTLRVHLTPFFGRMRLDAIGLREIELFKAKKLKEKMAPKSINNHLTILRRLLAVAVEWGQLTHIPLVKWLRVPDPEFDFFTFDEAERLVAGADGLWQPMITLALKTGLRLGELLALRWDDVDLVNGRLVVRRAAARGVIGTPKNGRSREIPLSADALRALKGHRHLKGELVFSDEKGKLLAKTATKWPLWRACKRAGLRRIGWHVLRHTFASHLVMRGAPIKAAQELLGHSTVEMTMRYAHLSPDVRRDAVCLLDGPSNEANGNLTATRGEGSKK